MAKRYDVDYPATIAAFRRVHQAMIETDARWVAAPQRLSTGVCVGTIEVSDPQKWEEIAKPMSMRPMVRRIDYLQLAGSPALSEAVNKVRDAISLQDDEARARADASPHDPRDTALEAGAPWGWGC